ncbi:hypothetical protein GOV10_06955 [Candidatus Woesearchaeota archaeon]|nr:hypothetical protein [Candidatus Woesearchaeota archaeon]
MRAKRESLQVIYDILEAIRNKDGKIKPTHIMYKANLSHQMLKEYLADLMSRGFVVEQKNKKGNLTYSLSTKGFSYLSEFSVIEKFMNSFGLDEEQE